MRETSAPKSDAGARVVAVKPSGSSTPFFFLHGDWLRGAFFCYPLANGLGAEQPFCVLHPYELAELPELPSIETIAREHLRALKTIQSQGPYRLGGFCNGALLAHEMALQLHAQGETVDLVVLMDPMEPFPRTWFTQTYRLMRRLGSILNVQPSRLLDVFALSAHFVRYARHAFASLRKPHYRRLVARERSAERLDGLDLIYPHLFKRWPSFRELRYQYEDVFSWIAFEYRPKTVFSGKIALLWNSEEPRSFRRAAWNDLVRQKEPGDVMIRTMAGSHNTCKTDHVLDMANQLKACLDWIDPAS